MHMKKVGMLKIELKVWKCRGVFSGKKDLSKYKSITVQ